MPDIRTLRVTSNFRFGELCVSAQHPELVEDVPEQLQPTACTLIYELLQPIRTRAKTRVDVLSGYRAPRLNSASGGSKSSQHMRAEAADIVAKGLSAKELFQLIRTHERELNLGQAILYDTFVHVALPSKKYPRPTYFEVVAGQLRLI